MLQLRQFGRSCFCVFTENHSQKTLCWFVGAGALAPGLLFATGGIASAHGLCSLCVRCPGAGGLCVCGLRRRPRAVPFFRTPHLHTTGIVNDCAVCLNSIIVCLSKVACAPVGAVYVASRARQPTGTA